MAGLVPFNRKNNSLARTGFDDFYNMLDDFFSDSWPSRSLLKDTFKIDVRETENEYLVEAEMPGVKKEEIDLSINAENLCIAINRNEETNQENENYIHRERRTSSMSRRLHLAEAKLDEIKAKLEDGVLSVSIPKQEKSANQRKIDIE